MLMTGKCVQITQLPDGDHADKIFLMPRQRNLIGFLAPAKKNGNRKSLGIRVGWNHQRPLGGEARPGGMQAEVLIMD
jgi:hypothetical protein